MNSCDEIKEKLSGYIDSELPQQQTQQIAVHLAQCEECKRLHKELLDVQQKVKMVVNDQAEEDHLEKIMQEPAAKQNLQWGWLLIIISSIMMMLYALACFITDEEINSFEKITAILLGAGGILLFLGVIRQRIAAAKSDKYKDINL